MRQLKTYLPGTRRIVKRVFEKKDRNGYNFAVKFMGVHKDDHSATASFNVYETPEDDEHIGTIYLSMDAEAPPRRKQAMVLKGFFEKPRVDAMRREMRKLAGIPVYTERWTE